MLVFNFTLAFFTIALHVLAVTLLSFSYSSAPTGPRNGKPTATAIQVATATVGLVAGSLTLGLPYLLDLSDPVAGCLIRIACFFYGCKVLDLSVIRARSPPVLLARGQREPITSAYSRLKYIWLLLTEVRYAAFDIATRQQERVYTPSRAWTFGPPILIPLVVCVFPTAETKSLLVLLIIQFGLDGLHTALHPRCADNLFWRPFAAPSLTSFWRTHWHAGAETFLRSLAYSPARYVALRLGMHASAARAVGVLAAFNLSGLWHGWATAVLATRPWMVGLRVWSLFVSMGIGVLLENWIPRERRGSLAQRILVWVVFVVYAGWAWRGLQSNCKVQWLAKL